MSLRIFKFMYYVRKYFRNYSYMKNKMIHKGLSPTKTGARLIYTLRTDLRGTL